MEQQAKMIIKNFTIKSINSDINLKILSAGEMYYLSCRWGKMNRN